MNVRQLNSQTIVTTNLKSKLMAMLRGLLAASQNFHAPFSERRALLILGDSILILLSLTGAFVLWQLTNNSFFDPSRIATRWYLFPTFLAGWWILGWLNNLYDIPSSADKLASAVGVLITGVCSLVIYLAIFFLIPSTLPRVTFLYFLAFALISIMLWRQLYALSIKLRPFQHRVLIVGRTMGEKFISETFAKAAKINYEVIGYVTEEAEKADTTHTDLPVWDQDTDLPALVKQHQVRELVILNENNLKQPFFQRLIDCQAIGIKVTLMSDLYEKLYHKVAIEQVNPAWVLGALQNRPVFSRFQLALKRLLDLLLSGIGLITLAPLVPLIALAIWLDSPGPIFYMQTRCGRAGKPFKIIKFRTMTTGAEKDGKAQWATKNDIRITRVGRILRKTRLDELPQFVNILRGEMSIVGPRPERPEFVAELDKVIPFYRTRLTVKPGLTGWAQTHYDYGNTIEDALIKLQYDVFYLRYGSLWLDIYTIFRTIAVVLRFKGT